MKHFGVPLSRAAGRILGIAAMGLLLADGQSSAQTYGAPDVTVNQSVLDSLGPPLTLPELMQGAGAGTGTVQLHPPGRRAAARQPPSRSTVARRTAPVLTPPTPPEASPPPATAAAPAAAPPATAATPAPPVAATPPAASASTASTGAPSAMPLPPVAPPETAAAPSAVPAVPTIPAPPAAPAAALAPAPVASPTATIAATPPTPLTIPSLASVMPAASAAPPPAPATPTAGAAVPPTAAPAPPAAAPTQTASLPPRGGLPAQVNFSGSDTDLPDQAKLILDRVVQALQADPQLRIELVAYASGSADQASQARRISLSRALSVRAYLIEKGVDSQRFEVRALGNRTDNGGAAADRVDILSLSN